MQVSETMEDTATHWISSQCPITKSRLNVVNKVYEFLEPNFQNLLDMNWGYSDEDAPEKYLFFVGREREEINYFLSNFYPEPEGHWAPLSDGRWYNMWCGEQHFQCFKPEMFETCSKAVLRNMLEIRSSGSSAQDKISAETIKTMGSRKETRMTIDPAKWDPVAPLCMLKVVIHKFVQNDALRDSLMATFPKDIVEAAHYDYVWGVGKPEFNKYNEDGLLKKDGILTLNAQDEISWQQPPTSWKGKNYLGKIETMV